MVDSRADRQHGAFDTQFGDKSHGIDEFGNLQETVIAEVIGERHLYLVGSTDESRHTFDTILSEAHFTTLIGEVGEILHRRARVYLSQAFREFVDLLGGEARHLTDVCELIRISQVALQHPLQFLLSDRKQLEDTEVHGDIAKRRFPCRPLTVDSAGCTFYLPSYGCQLFLFVDILLLVAVQFSHFRL